MLKRNEAHFFFNELDIYWSEGVLEGLVPSVPNNLALVAFFDFLEHILYIDIYIRYLLTELVVEVEVPEVVELEVVVSILLLVVILAA